MMNVSERYRELVDEVMGFARSLQGNGEAEPARSHRQVQEAAAALDEYRELVGEIPRIKLEAKLTPVLLKSHAQLDRARLLLEEEGAADLAAGVWQLEQKIYRLLNEL
ncbi:hypothetical protein SAMN05660860_00289 [Geoalkalibacter ferrihydriticus]|uniref:Uncharacterized protein n=2 Tax=Geoalkalibacter ferrihydriticus TaxID=392333 RepID=A0A0C2HS41_9BACT|nr:hypothetical protein [Geoalkalibacter ferrihydriticus]KIH75587.1 hypothetical protein GFER_15700 [Geoalkalibacter ferrihydriticus DSM 17813]SDL30643.1 hypothetical protein SAMN05660860_00289 [Geoalkalibacter ferrihydriticus]